MKNTDFGLQDFLDYVHSWMRLPGIEVAGEEMVLEQDVDLLVGSGWTQTAPDTLELPGRKSTAVLITSSRDGWYGYIAGNPITTGRVYQFGQITDFGPLAQYAEVDIPMANATVTIEVPADDTAGDSIWGAVSSWELRAIESDAPLFEDPPEHVSLWGLKPSYIARLNARKEAS